MICPECGKDILTKANFCSNCGAVVDKKKKKTPAPKALIFVVLLGIVLGGAAIFFNLNKKTTALSENISLEIEEAATGKAKERPLGETLKKKAPRLVSGSVDIKDPDFEVAASIQGVSAGGSWIALPARACIGGDTWVFREDAYPNSSFDIEEGIWDAEHPIGLWKINRGRDADEYSLSSWDGARPLFWLSQAPGASKQPVQVSIAGRQPMFRFCRISEKINEPGVFIQDDRVVGWTFGPLFELGCLFSGTPDDLAAAAMTADLFYDLTFAFSREQQFSKALAITPDDDPFHRLRAFAQGFLLDSKLSPEIIPERLSAKNALENMHALADACFQTGFYMEGADALTLRVVARTLDFGLCRKAVRLTLAAYGYDRALAFAQGISQYAPVIFQENADAINTMHARLYLDYIQSLIVKNDIRRGWEIFDQAKRHFQTDPGVHMMGVQLALAENDWAVAENLLGGMPSRPPDMEERIVFLEATTARLKGREGKIIVRFNPDSGVIPILARLNGTVEQLFVVDTGATLTSIPSHVLEELGIKINPSAPRRKLSTAGKIIIAPEIHLSSIEIGGWSEQDIKAVVLDIPGQKTTGLLGMNYLERFKIDINTQEGILSLEPR